MRRVATAHTFVAAALLAIGCGGGSGSGHPSGHVSAPTDHRIATPVCEPRPAGDCQNPVGVNQCSSDSDCGAGIDGRCTGTETMCECDYSACVTDADCAAGTDCLCGYPTGVAFFGGGSHCVESNCRTDADCGPGGSCSFAMTNVTGCFSTVGWYCHTAHDECGVDADCVSDSSTTPVPLCLFVPERGIWACSSGVRCSG